MVESESKFDSLTCNTLAVVACDGCIESKLLTRDVKLCGESEKCSDGAWVVTEGLFYSQFLTRNNTLFVERTGGLDERGWTWVDGT